MADITTVDLTDVKKEATDKIEAALGFTTAEEMATDMENDWLKKVDDLTLYQKKQKDKEDQIKIKLKD